MTIGISDIWKGNFLCTEIVVLDYCKIIVETISIQTRVTDVKDILVAREKIQDILSIAYPNSTTIRDNEEVIQNFKETSTNKTIKTNKVRSLPYLAKILGI